MSRKAKSQLETVLFSLPAIILVCLMMYLPFVLSGYYSLTEWNGISKDAQFIGLQNFKIIFVESRDFLSSLWFTTRYTVFFVIFSNIFALALAVVLTKKFRAANFFRGVFFIPYIMSMTIVGFIWKFIFTSGFEKLYGITEWNLWNYSWLGDTNLVFYSVAFVGVWQSLGFYTVLYIAGLHAWASLSTMIGCSYSIHHLSISRSFSQALARIQIGSKEWLFSSSTTPCAFAPSTRAR